MEPCWGILHRHRPAAAANSRCARRCLVPAQQRFAVGASIVCVSLHWARVLDGSTARSLSGAVWQAALTLVVSVRLMRQWKPMARIISPQTAATSWAARCSNAACSRWVPESGQKAGRHRFPAGAATPRLLRLLLRLLCSVPALPVCWLGAALPSRPLGVEQAALPASALFLLEEPCRLAHRCPAP